MTETEELVNELRLVIARMELLRQDVTKVYEILTEKGLYNPVVLSKEAAAQVGAISEEEYINLLAGVTDTEAIVPINSMREKQQ